MFSMYTLQYITGYAIKTLKYNFSLYFIFSILFSRSIYTFLLHEIWSFSVHFKVFLRYSTRLLNSMLYRNEWKISMKFFWQDCCSWQEYGRHLCYLKVITIKILPHDHKWPLKSLIIELLILKFHWWSSKLD